MSANVDELLGRSPTDVLGEALFDLIEPESFHSVEKALLVKDPRGASPLWIIAREAWGGGCFDGILHRSEGLVILELERAPSPALLSSMSFYQNGRRAVGRLQRAGRVLEMCQLAVDEVAKLTGFDRVMAYRFDRDDHGHVVAEAKRADLESFLDLHYPASDIPVQARHLYTLNWLRLIADVNYRPARLVPPDNPLTGRPLDLSLAVLRSVSPIHIQYLVNMRVGASMSVSLVLDGRLWGLLICHHYTPRFVPYEIRAVCEFLGQALSWQVAARERADASESRARAQRDLSKLIGALGAGNDLASSLVSDSSALLDLVDAKGAAVRVGGAWRCVGRTPKPHDLEKIANRLLRLSSNGLAATESMVGLDPDARRYADIASGALSVRFLPERDDLVIWFRPEVLETVNWAGDPHNKASLEDGAARLSPRGSFALWRETVRSRALPWQSWEIEAAVDLRRAIEGNLSRRNDELLTQNALLEARVIERTAALIQATHALGDEITERKRIETSLRLSEERLALTLNSIGDAVISTDTLGLVERMNPVAERLTGWALSAARGKSINEVFRIVDGDTGLSLESPAVEVLGRRMSTGLASHTMLVARDETRIPIEDSAAPIRNEHGETLGLVVVFRDTTATEEHRRSRDGAKEKEGAERGPRRA